MHGDAQKARADEYPKQVPGNPDKDLLAPCITIDAKQLHL